MLCRLDDPDTIAPWLRRDRGLHVYELGDLDPQFWPHTRFYGWEHDGALRAVAMLYTAAQPWTLLALGDAADPHGMTAALVALDEHLPREVYGHLSPGLLEPLVGLGWQAQPGGPHLKMVLRHPEQLAGIEDHDVAVLGPADLAAARALYTVAYPGNWFDPRMLETGHYCGVWTQGALVAIAGVHVYAPTQSVAALGNITTHPDARRQGLARRVTAALCRKLLATVELVGLNVHADNAAAIACYHALGFRPHAPYDEVMLRRP